MWQQEACYPHTVKKSSHCCTPPPAGQNLPGQQFSRLGSVSTGLCCLLSCKVANAKKCCTVGFFLNDAASFRLSFAQFCWHTVLRAELEWICGWLASFSSDPPGFYLHCLAHCLLLAFLLLPFFSLACHEARALLNRRFHLVPTMRDDVGSAPVASNSNSHCPSPWPWEQFKHTPYNSRTAEAELLSPTQAEAEAEASHCSACANYCFLSCLEEESTTPTLSLTDEFGPSGQWLNLPGRREMQRGCRQYDDDDWTKPIA